MRMATHQLVADATGHVVEIILTILLRQFTVEDHLQQQITKRVLEIGPGIGYYSLEAARRVGREGRLVCLDLQRDMLRETRRRLHQRQASACCVQASAETLPLVVIVHPKVSLPAREGLLSNAFS